jgi:tol-pal system protein YbgF
MLRRPSLVLPILLALSAPAFAQDAADVVVRLGRLENQMRTMSGQIEQLQFENRQLKEQVRKFQEDVEFRFQESRGAAPAARPSAPPAATQTPATGPVRPGSPSATPPAAPQRRSDAFDPSLAPDAPGAPRPLGTTPPSAPLAAAPPPSAPPPMSLPGGALADAGEAEIDEDLPPGTAPLDLSQTGRTAAIQPPATAPRPGPSVAATGSGDPRTDYDAAYAYLLQNQYEQAEMGFRRFLQSHPRDRLVPDATYWLGESYLRRSRHREAAEQFLTISTEHAASPKAPDAMLKLGIALNALGAKDRACAVFAELDRKYPQATAVRQGSEREQKRARCV